MNELTQLLKNSSLFCDLSPETIQNQLLPLGNIQEFSKGSYLIMPQERLDSFGFMVSGLIHTIHISIDGNWRSMDALETGEIFGADLM